MTILKNSSKKNRNKIIPRDRHMQKLENISNADMADFVDLKTGKIDFKKIDLNKIDTTLIKKIDFDKGIIELHDSLKATIELVKMDRADEIREMEFQKEAESAGSGDLVLKVEIIDKPNLDYFDSLVECSSAL